MPAHGAGTRGCAYVAVQVSTELDLASAGISAIIWATGYAFDFSLAKLPVFDQNGYSRQSRGPTDFPGLYFVSLQWLTKFKSGPPYGVGEDAAQTAASIVENARGWDGWGRLRVEGISSSDPPCPANP